MCVIYIYIYIYIHIQGVLGVIVFCGPGSSVGIVTDYGLDGPGSNRGHVSSLPNRLESGYRDAAVDSLPFGDDTPHQRKMHPGRLASSPPRSPYAPVRDTVPFCGSWHTSCISVYNTITRPHC